MADKDDKSPLKSDFVCDPPSEQSEPLKTEQKSDLLSDLTDKPPDKFMMSSDDDAVARLSAHATGDQLGKGGEAKEMDKETVKITDKSLTENDMKSSFNVSLSSNNELELTTKCEPDEKSDKKLEMNTSADLAVKSDDLDSQKLNSCDKADAVCNNEDASSSPSEAEQMSSLKPKESEEPSMSLSSQDTAAEGGSSGIEGDLDTDGSDGRAKYAKTKSRQEKEEKAPEKEAPQPTLRRSSRANKGIGKEIFDPSHIPKSRTPSVPEIPRRFTSPAPELSDSSFSSPTRGRGRPRKISQVSAESPQLRSALDKDGKTPGVEKEADKPGKKRADLAKTKSKEPIILQSKEDFSDDDDVPLTKLKPEEVEKKEVVKVGKGHSGNNKQIPATEKTKEVVPVNEQSSDSDDDSDSDDSYNNPDRLWCICRKPHNNRFMISCDQCEDWFHGDCVGITLQRGKKMEQDGEEYVCPKCVKTLLDKQSSDKGDPRYKLKLNEGRFEKHASRKRTSSSDDVTPKGQGLSLKDFALKGQIQKSSDRSGNGAPVKKKLKIFDERKSKKNRPPGSHSVKKHKSGGGKVVVKTSPANATPSAKTTSLGSKPASANPNAPRKCTVLTCENDALPGSVYCSNQCILRHAKESLKAIAKEKEKDMSKPRFMKREQQPSQQKDQRDRVSVHCKKTNKILSGNDAPMRRDLADFLKSHPSYEVYRPRPSSTQTDKSPNKSQAPGDVASKSYASLDFYRHVEHHIRKRDRYGTDPDYAPPVKKVLGGDGESLISEKRVKTSNVVKVTHESVSKPPKQKGSNPDPAKKQDAAKPHSEKKVEKLEKKQERKDVKEQRKKSSSEVTSMKKFDSGERSAVKVERSNSGSSKLESKPTGTPDIRLNVKKTLLEILKKRSGASDDLKMHRDSISRLATKIEDSLFKLFKDIGTKYKNKYRSIMFNLKDERNHGLWRKVIIGDVTTSELVQMTAEQMASKKLAEWRRNELTHELDIIEKQEKEGGNVRPVAKITHKGEIAIQEDLSDLTVTTVTPKDNALNPLVAPVRKKRASMSEDEPFDASLLPPGDTTLKHNGHLFDRDCKICTGKIREENIELPEETSKKAKSSSSIILSSEAQKATNQSPPIKAPTSHLFKADSSESKAAAKSERSLSDSRSHDPSLSPSTILAKRSKSPVPEKKKKKPILPSPPPLSDLAPHDEPPPASPKPSQVDDAPEPMEVEEAPSEDSPPTKKISRSDLIWSGSISMLELSTFTANVYAVTGNCENLDIDLPSRMVLGGRIHPKVVWDYLLKVKALPTKQLSIVRFHAASDDDRVGYVAMLSYFSSRKRFGVVSNQDRMLLKDMYLIPLLESQAVPPELIRTMPDGYELNDALPPNRPSMLLGIIVRQATKSANNNDADEVKKSLPAAAQELSNEPEGEEEYAAEPPAKASRAPLTDEQVESKATSMTGSLFERNKSLAPSLRFFMRKASEEKQSLREQKEPVEQPYSPSARVLDEEAPNEGGVYDPSDAIGEDASNEDEEPYDPEQEEEYDPETAFADDVPKDEDVPYDPEDAEELLQKEEKSMGVEELVEKQAFLEKMQRELEEKKAKLAEVEQTLQKSTVDPPRVDPRLARRAAQQAPPPAIPEVAPSPAANEPPKNPLQTILSALNMSGGSQAASSGFLSMFQNKAPSPPPLPDSTTKSDPEEGNDPVGDNPSSKGGLVSYSSTPDSSKDDVTLDDVANGKKGEERRKGRRKDERHNHSSSSDSSRDGSHRRRHHDSGGHHDDRRHKKSGRRSRSRSPTHRGRRHHGESPHHRRHDDDHRSRNRRSWSRDRRR